MNALGEIRDTKPDRLATLDKQTGTDPPMIIVAEDDEEMASLLVRAFERAGYAVTSCQTGWDLLRSLGVFPANDTFNRVALVVSDIRLPGMSGLDVLKVCGYVGRFPPIILITAFGDNWTREKARKLGALDMLDKPFDIDELVDRVRRIVPRSL
jgi:DNA-binding response OmpR family regulator